MAGRVLKSQWGSMSPILLAELFPVDRDGNQDMTQDVVVAPPIEGSIELSANWQSPFENMGPESKAPALMAMIQTGMLSSTFMSLTGAASALVGGAAEAAGFDRAGQWVQSAADGIDATFSDAASKLFGLTGMTKLNSTQVFTGAAPVKIPLTLHFRAFEDAKAEVQDPIDTLAYWTLPLELSVEGTISGGIKGLARLVTGNADWAATVFPSRAPRYVGLRYGGYTFAPLVIESLSHPLVVPRTVAGSPLEMQVQVSLASVTALDQNDWRRARSGHPTRMFATSKR